MLTLIQDKLLLYPYGTACKSFLSLKLLHTKFLLFMIIEEEQSWAGKCESQWKCLCTSILNAALSVAGLSPFMEPQTKCMPPYHINTLLTSSRMSSMLSSRCYGHRDLIKSISSSPSSPLVSTVDSGNNLILWQSFNTTVFISHITLIFLLYFRAWILPFY